MSNVVFEYYSIEVKNVIKEKAISFLYEVGEEILSRTKRNSRRDTSQTAGSYDRNVDEDGLVVTIGSNYMNAIWEEFGTGIHAKNGDGRKTAWRYKDRHGKWHTTKGKTANRPLERAFESAKGAVQHRAEQIFGGI